MRNGYFDRFIYLRLDFSDIGLTGTTCSFVFTTDTGHPIYVSAHFAQYKFENDLFGKSCLTFFYSARFEKKLS